MQCVYIHNLNLFKIVQLQVGVKLQCCLVGSDLFLFVIIAIVHYLSRLDKPTEDVALKRALASLHQYIVIARTNFPRMKSIAVAQILIARHRKSNEVVEENNTNETVSESIVQLAADELTDDL